MVSMSYAEQEYALVAAPRKDGEPFLRQTYRDALTQAGFQYDVIYPGMSQDEVDLRYNRAHALVLVGGHDWNAAIYGQEPSPHNDTPDDLQDESEKQVLMRALNDGLPTLGICRGEQGMGIVLAEAQGVDLRANPLMIQHLPDITTVQHGVDSYEQLRGNTHGVAIKQGTIAHQIFQQNQIDVSSGHHQALNKQVLDQITALVVSGMSLDQIVEMMELRPDVHPFYVGVQTHPEVFEHLYRPLFGRLAEEARKFARSTTYIMR
jgi:gamma-glutamyl-gamma-aminobutyrate hydrolase PuuD